jgi:hypothetical protein
MPYEAQRLEESMTSSSGPKNMPDKKLAEAGGRLV